MRIVSYSENKEQDRFSDCDTSAEIYRYRSLIWNTPNVAVLISHSPDYSHKCHCLHVLTSGPSVIRKSDRNTELLESDRSSAILALQTSELAL